MKCNACGAKVFDLFKEGDVWRCCECKFGSPLTPNGHHPQTLFSSRPQPFNLDYYDKVCK